MKPVRTLPRTLRVETLVHVSANASAADDLRNAEKIRQIQNWETQRHFPIYPPPQIPKTSPRKTSRSQSNEPDPVRVKTPEPEPHIPAPESPSQIPDSQPLPTTAVRPARSVISLSPHTPTPTPTPKYTTPAKPSPPLSPPKPTPRIYHTAKRPPRSSSLKPVTLSPPTSPAPSECSISPDRLPNKFPIFTSTPKSKPLKQLLPDTEKHEISFPMPRVDSDKIPLLPPHLAQLPLSLYRRKAQTRDLLDWERGYWKVNLSSWREDHKLDFWKKLRKAVQGGRYGWIYIVFDSFEEDVLNVFCYGGAAQYVWVLLYVLSSKRTKHGLMYLDSTEQVIIEGTLSSSS